MAATLEVESTLTVPPSEEVVPTRVDTSDGDDPVLGQFLGFLAADISHHPDQLQTVDAFLVQRLQSLLGHVNVDLDAALFEYDE